MASLPDATVIEQSDSFIARISLTPSPVMATVCPAFFNALTRMAFCSGVTRPNTLYFVALAASLIPSRLTYLSAPSTPARFATSETVTGLSPDITLTLTSFFLNQSIVFIASRRILSLSVTMANGRISYGN